MTNQDNTHFVESEVSDAFENKHMITHTMTSEETESNHSFHSRSSKSNYSLQGKFVEKVRKNSYNDIAFPVETEANQENINVGVGKNSLEMVNAEVRSRVRRG